jgi:hypothetical protein
MKPVTPTPSLADADPVDLERALRESRTLQDAPEHLIQRAIDLWQHRPMAQAAQAAEGPGVLRRVLAALRFDSHGSSALAMGLRSSAVAETQQLLFSADGHDIDLRITPVTADDGQPAWEVRGQVFGPSAAGRVELVSDEVCLSQPWDDLGEFSFSAVGAGPWRAVQHGAGVEIETPSFDLGSAAASGRAGG